MNGNMRISSKSLLFLLILMMQGGCISVPFELAGSVIESTGDVVESVVEVPVDVTTSLLDVPASYKTQYVEDQNFEFSAASIQCLSLDENNGWVKIYASDQDYIRVEAEKITHARNDSSAEKYARKLEVICLNASDALRIYRQPVHDPDWVRVQVNYTIYLPVDMDLNLNVHSGDVEVWSLRGDIRIENHNGRVSLNQCSGMFDIQAQNGSLIVDRSVIERTSKLATHNGSQTVSLEGVEAPLTMDSRNGPIKLNLEKDVDARLDVESHNGDLHFDLPVRVFRSSRNRLLGEIGNGGETKITIRNNNGEITLSEIFE